MSLEVQVVVQTMRCIDMSAEDHQCVDKRMADASYLLEQTLDAAHAVLHDTQ